MTQEINLEVDIYKEVLLGAKALKSLGLIGLDLGFAQDKWRAMCASDPKITEVYSYGKEKLFNELLGVCIKQARSGNTYFAFFILERFAGYYRGSDKLKEINAVGDLSQYSQYLEPEEVGQILEIYQRAQYRSDQANKEQNRVKTEGVTVDPGLPVTEDY